MMDDDASRQQIRVPTSQLPRARPGQQEPEPPWVRVDDGLHGVQERGDALDLVNQHRANAGARGQQLPLEPLRIGDELAKRGEAGEIQREIGLERTEEGRLANLTRTEHEDVGTVLPQPAWAGRVLRI
jgi:hypothetical protein